jgi:peptidyl-prolyl cis-trans isomerase SurA
MKGTESNRACCSARLCGAPQNSTVGGASRRDSHKDIGRILMMLRAVARVSFPLAFAAFCTVAVAQSTPAGSTQPSAPTLASSTSLSGSSNALANLYGTPVVQIIARVNDRVITNSDLQRAEAQLADDSRQNNWTLEQYNKAQKNLLRDLIDQQLLLSKGKQLGITGDTELIKRLDDIRKQNHLATLDDLEKAVEQQGTSYEDFKANIRNNIITQEVVRDEVGSHIQISQPEIRQYYQQHLDRFTQPESVHLREILIPTPENPTDAQLNAAEAKAKEVESKLKAGGNFQALAKEYSGGPTAQEGGDLGDFKRGALAKVLEDQTFNLPVGGYTAPIRTRQGYIILQVTRHIPGGTQPMQKVEPEIEQDIYMQKISPAVRQYLTRLREEAYIDIRPGFTDSAASSKETKPTYAAYTPPQPKKKKKKKRFERGLVAHQRMTERGRTPVAVAASTAPAGTAAVAAGAGSAGTPSTTTAGTAAAGATKSSHRHLLRKTSHAHAHKPKRQKLRFGQAPPESVSQEQVATGSTSAPAAPAAAPESTDNAALPASALAPDVQPLGPDLEHAPVVNAPKQGKSRLSDRLRDKQKVEHKKHAKHHAKKAKKAKPSTTPSALTPEEQADQKVQSAPLGLSGSSTQTKKKKATPAHTGKTRLSNQKKESETAAPADSSSSSGSSQPQP